MKTLEELAIEIQNGDKSRVPELWGRLQRLYLRKSFDYYAAHRTQCDRCGVTVEDIQQQAFFAFLRSVDAYEPECELAFTSYIRYPFLTEMQELTRTRSSGQRQDVMCSPICGSLDKEIENEDGSGDTLGDFVPDLTALDFLERLDAQSVGAMIRAEVRKLSAPLCDVIAAYYFDGRTLDQIAEQLGLSRERVRQLRKRGELTLAKRRVLVDLWNEYNHTEQLRQLERTAGRFRPDEYSSGRTYDQQTQPRPKNCIDYAAEYAEQQRQLSGKSREEWTREEQIAAMLEYLHREPATA